MLKDWSEIRGGYHARARAMPARFHGLDALRVFAALSVFVTHLYMLHVDVPVGFFGELFWAYEIGHVAVNAFFVMSAFLLTIHLLQRPGYPDYLLRRIKRIAPAYYVSVAILFAAGAYWMEIPRSEWVMELWLHLFFLQGTATPPGLGVNLVYWTLSVEMIGYLLLPLIIRVVFSGIGGLVLMLALTAAWKFALMKWFQSHETVNQFIWYAFPSFLFDFAIGVQLAKSVMDGDRMPAVADKPWLAVGTLCVWVAFLPGWQSTQILAFPITAILAAWAVHAFMKDERTNALGARDGMRIAADMSYSFYLWHAVVIYTVVQLGGAHALVGVPASLLLSAVIAWLSMRYIERQFK